MNRTIPRIGAEAAAAALLLGCAYFLPVGILAFRHFGKKD